MKESIVDKWDTKVFGKGKFQEEHRLEKMDYDRASGRMKELGVKDKLDLMRQERKHESSVKEIQPKLQAEKLNLAPTLNVLQGALQALDGALRAEKQEQRREQSKLTKAFRNKNMENDLDYTL